MSKAWDSGSTRQWRRVRAAVLQQNQLPLHMGGNDGRCRQQIPGVCTGQATQVHHVLGRAVTGDDPRYLQATCRECNQHIGEPKKFEPQPKIRSRWA